MTRWSGFVKRGGATLAGLTLVAACAAPPVSEAPSDAEQRSTAPPPSNASAATASPDGTTETPAGTATTPLPPMVMPTFIVGYNEAWFGMKYGTGLTTDFDLAYVNSIFDGIVEAGGHVVRIFLFELLQGITLGPNPPQTQSLSPAMLANVGKVLDAARARGLWVYVTGLQANEMSKVPATKTYYKNLMNNTAGEGAAFETNVLGPLLKLLDAHRENIFGLDVINEIDAARRDGLWGSPFDFSGQRAFTQRTVAFVKSKSPWIRVTTTVGWGGAQHEIIAGQLSGLGLDFYDLHVYSDSGSYSGVTNLCSRAAADGIPIYLGEFGQKSERIDDTLQYNAAATFLSTAKNSCFKGALAWRFDSAENWWAFIRPDGSFRPAVSLMQTFGAPQ